MSALAARTSPGIVALLVAAGWGAGWTASAHAYAPQLAPPTPLTDTIPSPTILPPLDLDGDGDDDILVAAVERATLNRFENLGGGRFGRIEIIGSVPSQRALWALADMDGDGDTDAVAVTVETAQIYVLRNLGDGTFAAPIRIVALAGNAIDLHIGDFDADGFSDIVVTTDSPSPSARGVFLVRRRTNTLVFASPRRVTPWAATATATGPTLIVDIDGDLDLDTIVTDRSTLTISWYRNFGGGPSAASLTLPDRFRTIGAVAAADVDGDGDNDIIVAAEPWQPGSLHELRWYRNNGGGAFNLHAIFDASPTATTSLTVADLDGDGDLDVIATHADGAPPTWHESDGTGPQPGAHALPVHAGWSVSRAALSDLDGDGTLDLVLSCATQQVGWCKGASTGSIGFRAPNELTARTEGARDTALLDLDGDGDIDVLVGQVRAASGTPGGVASGYLSLIENLHVDGFARPVHVLGGPGELAGLERIETGDLDGDGDDDLVIASFSEGWLVWSENRAGVLAPPTPLSTFPPSTRGTLRLADLDDDGDVDVVVSSASTPGVTWFEQRATGLDPTPRVALSGPSAIFDFIVSDIDADGHIDLVVNAPSDGPSIGWFRGQGGGMFLPRVAIATVNTLKGALVAFDGDGDGDLDIATAGIGFIFPILEWIPQTAPGQFGTPVYGGSATLGWPLLVAADLDLDGDGELIATPMNSGGNPTDVTVYRAPYDGPYPVPRQWPLGVTSLTLGDIDGDGDADLLVTSEAGDSVDVLFGTTHWSIGDLGCVGALNSTGTSAKLDAVGTPHVADNDVQLRAFDLPRDTFAFFLASRTAGYSVSPGGSTGTLCLGGAIGRYVGAGEVQNSGRVGLAELALDLTQIPQPLGTVAATLGETWHFQAWYRDRVGGLPTSNFSGSVLVTLR